jgi:hypothetical protein
MSLNETPPELNEEGAEMKEGSTVSYETHKRTLAQRVKLKSELDEMKAKVAEFEAQMEERKNSELKEQGRYKELLTSAENKIKELSEKERLRERELLDSFKLNAVLEKLPGQLKRREYMDFIDIDSLPYEDGVVSEDALKNVVDSFVKDHSSLIEFKKGAELPNNFPQGAKPLSMTQELAECKTQGQLDAVMKKYGKI